LLALSAAASLALGADPPSADPDAAADPPPPPCTLAARLAARNDTAAFLALLEARGLGPDIRRADLPPLTLVAPTDAALAASVLPRDATEADGGGDGGGGGAPPGSVAALVASAPAALPIVVGGHRLGTRIDLPQVGQHTRELLSDLGYATSEIDRMIADGVARAGA
jgi:hypothetical protein